MLPAVKVGVAAAGTASLAVGGWAMQLVAQIDGGNGDAISTLIPAAALTATSGALVWVVRQVVGGNLVHRDPQQAANRLDEALERTSAALAASNQREDHYRQWIVGMRRRHDED